MRQQEWRTTDKTLWDRGAWDTEADKVQWVDEATGLDCLIKRGPHGALCGYVGVPEGHPLFGGEYDAPDVDVHGGLTYADSCQEPTEEQFEAMRRLATDQGLIARVQRHPFGDDSLRLREAQRALDMTFEEWRAHQMPQRICHIPEAGRPALVWWFGFDCAHSMDACPGYSKYPKIIPGYPDIASLREGAYRTIDYVQRECTELARQLAAVA